MRTFHGKVSLDFKVVVPDTFVQLFRDAAVQEDATPFLLAVQAQHPKNDEAFIQAVISNGIRLATRAGVLNMLSDGVGGTVSPASIEIIGVPRDFNTDVQPEVLDVHDKKGGAELTV